MGHPHLTAKIYFFARLPSSTKEICEALERSSERFPRWLEAMAEVIESQTRSLGGQGDKEKEQKESERGNMARHNVNVAVG